MMMMMVMMMMVMVMVMVMMMMMRYPSSLQFGAKPRHLPYCRASHTAAMPVGVGGGKERGGFHLNLRT